MEHLISTKVEMYFACSFSEIYAIGIRLSESDPLAMFH